MKHAMLATMLAKDVVPTILYVIDKLKDSGCFVWASLSESWDKSSWPEAQTTYLNHEDVPEGMYSLDELKQIINNPDSGSSITGDKETVYFYIFSDKVSEEDKQLIPSILQRMRALFVNANGEKKVSMKYGYNESSKTGYAGSRSETLDKRIIEKNEKGIKFYMFNDVKIACLRISGHSSSWCLLRQYLRKHISKNLPTFFDPSDREEIDIYLYKALRYVKTKFSGNFLKKEKKMQEKIYQYLLNKGCTYMDKATSKSIGLKEDLADTAYNTEEYFDVENSAVDYYCLLKTEVTEILQDISNKKALSFGEKEKAVIRELEERVRPLEQIQKYFKNKMANKLFSFLDGIIKDIESKKKEVHNDPRYERDIRDCIGKRQSLKQILRSIRKDVENGNIEQEVAPGVIKYFKLDAILKDLKDARKLGVQRIEGLIANTIIKFTIKPVNIFETLDKILETA